MKSAISAMETDSVPSVRSDVTVRSKTIFAVLKSPFNFRDLFRSGTQGAQRKT